MKLKSFIVILSILIIVLAAYVLLVFFEFDKKPPSVPQLEPTTQPPVSPPLEPAPEIPSGEVVEEEKEEGMAEARPAPALLKVPPQEPQEFIVDIYSFTDWQPSSLIIYVGDTITFINHDNKLHWPGADPHPTHSSLPLFDALGGISKEQSYSHTFHKPGVYGHHDHLLEVPPTIGFITILPRFIQ